jgi:meso-butanediol dehydrogenase / (S,S)-butanediol dehydrogenase / diacetyl reductase
MNRFNDKVVIVTGAASGIGRATAERLASEGATLALADIQDLDEVTNSLGEKNNVTGHQFDATDSDSCEQLISNVVAAHGRLDCLCNIAGIMGVSLFTAESEEAWNRMLRINLTSVFLLSQQAMPHLIESKGNIVNMASASGLQGIAYTAAYSAAKAGVIGLTRSIATEFAHQGVRANAVCPGGVKTPMNDSTDVPEEADPAFFERLWPKLGDLCEPEEIAAAVAYLASDEACNVTGIAFAIDGGQMLG